VFFGVAGSLQRICGKDGRPVTVLLCTKFKSTFYHLSLLESLGLVCCNVAYQCTLEKQFHTFECDMAIFLVLESLVGYKILWFKLFLHSIFFTTSSQMFSCLIVWIQFGPMFVVCSAKRVVISFFAA